MLWETRKQPFLVAQDGLDQFVTDPPPAVGQLYFRDFPSRRGHTAHVPLRLCTIDPLRDRPLGDERCSRQLTRRHPIRLSSAPQCRQQIKRGRIGIVSPQQSIPVISEQFRRMPDPRHDADRVARQVGAFACPSTGDRISSVAGVVRAPVFSLTCLDLNV